MADSNALAQQFTAALSAPDRAALTALLADDAALRLAGWNGAEGYRPRERVIDRLRGEWEAWPDARLETLATLGGDGRAAVEFRIQATDPASGRYVEHYRSAFLTLAGDCIAIIDLYCAEPLPSARRKGWIAPADLTEEQINDLFASFNYAFDRREWIPPVMNGRLSLRELVGGSGDAHPGSNFVGGIRWPADEADARIEDIIEAHRQKNIGFTWQVAPSDTPADLAQRLERHGLALAGEQSMMVRLGLEDLDGIPVNPDLRIERLGPDDEAALDACTEITTICFNWVPEQATHWRQMLADRVKDQRVREYEFNYLGYLDGRPVAEARLLLAGGIAYLGGAATLPGFRSRKIYSSLLRRRLEVARDQGYHVAAIHAEPLSRRVVVRYGFRECAKSFVYAWMPVMDMDVVRSLVPQD